MAEYNSSFTGKEIDERLGKVPELEATVGQLSAEKENKLDVAAYGLPILKLTGDVSAMSKDNAVDLAYEYGDLSGTASVKWQGASSIAWEKKNYTIKFDQAFEAADGWGEQKKYCLKANFIDHSHARNVVSAKLWGEIVKSRPYQDNYLDISRITGLLSIEGADRSGKISIQNGVLTSTASTWNDSWVTFDGVKFDKGTYKVRFEHFNPNTAETDTSGKVVVGFYTIGVGKAAENKTITFAERQEWVSWEGEFSVTEDDAGFCLMMLGDQPSGISPYQFRNIEVGSTSSHLNKLKNLPNGGAVDGFPCVIVLNNEFHGLYTFNIPKDGWMLGMGDGSTEAIVGANTHSVPTQFKGEATLTEADFEVEYAPNENETEWIKTSLNTLINAVINSDGTDLDTVVSQYLDWQSAIDYYIYVSLIRGDDMMDKNYLLCTYDGVKWFFTAYDMDSVYGLLWSGKKLLESHGGPDFNVYAANHKVMELIKTYKTDALKERYAEIREDIMSERNIAWAFQNFVLPISKAILMEDVKAWPTIPGSAVNNTEQILNFYRMRVPVIDAQIESL